MKMNIEIKHLAAYLPYGLKIQLLRHEYFGIYQHYSLRNWSDYPISFPVNEGIEYAAMLSEVKPILRPLSDLTKEIEVNGEMFVPVERLDEIYGQTLESSEAYHLIQPITLEPYILIRQLLEWHFDIFNPNNLAIDINTLK